jgi:hypothetical protein
MKVICVLLFLSIFVGEAFAQSNEDELKEIILEHEDTSIEAYSQSALTKENNQRQVDLFNLQKAKFKLISGDLKLAEFFLNRISDKESALMGIKKRYLAIIYFINGRFDQSIATLDEKKINNNNYYVQNCLLRLINFMAVNDVAAIKRERSSCQFYTARYSKNDQFWLNTMITLKTADSKALKRSMMLDVDATLNNDEMARLWLKTGLYINKEKDLLDVISNLPESSYQSKRLREIVAFMYMRAGESKKALSFVDDIDSPNAENIKGNINLANKEYELAFGHFRLALQKKQDSTNSLERAIPLAWMLNQWNDGLMMLANISNKNLDPRNSAAIKIAFLIREKRFLDAQRELTLLKIAFQNEPPYEVNIMDTYVNLMLGENDKVYDKRRVEESAEKSCKAFDGISCWISLQYIQWENLGKTIKRDDPTYSDKTLTLESLKEKKLLEPLVESKSIDQSDIEELDGETIKVTPQ